MRTSQAILTTSLPISFLTTAWSFTAHFPQRHTSQRPTCFASNSKWDNLIDDDEDDTLQFKGGPPVPNDMKYNLFNIQRQRHNFDSIRSVAKDLTNDIYARDPDSDIFWYVGKVARVSGTSTPSSSRTHTTFELYSPSISDVTLPRAVSRQWPLIEEHSARLRPDELYPRWGSLELWVAPPDSELDVAYNRAEIRFVRMNRGEEEYGGVRTLEVGFLGEVYENGEEGFRTVRTEEGGPAGAEIGGRRAAEMEDLMEMIDSQATT